MWTAPLPRLWPFTVGVAVAALLHFAIQPAIGGFGSNLLFFAGVNVILAVSLTV